MACIYWNYVKKKKERERRAALEATPSVERMKSDVIIKLDHEDASYSAGDVVRGHIEVSLTNEVKVRDIVVRFNGVSRVSWDEQRTFTKGSATSISRKNTEVYLDQQYSVLRSKMKKRGSHASITSQHVQTATSGEGEERIIIIPAGSHVFPLEFPLPLDLPASFEGKWGQIKYWVKITLERPWKFDIEREKEFKVNAHVDLNLEPELVRPIGTLGEFEPGVICCRSGLVNVELKVTRRGFAPGENIPFTAEIENNSKQKMQDAKVALLQHVMYRIGDVSKKTTTAVTSLNKGEILPGETVTWERDSLLIPSLPPTSNKGMKVIHIKYTVSIRYSSWSDEYSLPVNIVLGTCGLRRSTINTYLALLGSATPRGTPRGTPCPSPRGSRVNLHQIGPALSLHIQGNSLDVPKIRAPRQSCPVLLGLPQESEHVRRGSGGASPRHPRKGGSLGGSRGNCRLISSSDENVESLQVPNFDSGNTSRRSSASSYRQRLDSVRETDAERV